MNDPVETPSWMKWIMRGSIALIVAAALVGGCSYVNSKIGMGDDHIIEEMIEQHIQDQIGLDIDLSHESPE